MEPVFRQTAIQAGVVTFPGSDVLPGSCPQTVKMCSVMSLCCHSFFFLEDLLMLLLLFVFCIASLMLPLEIDEKTEK